MSSHSVFHHFQTLEFCRRDVYFYKEFQDTGTKCDVTYKRRFTIANSYISEFPIKKYQLSNFSHYILFFIVERSRATPRGLAGHFWPAGHRLGTPGIAYNATYLVKPNPNTRSI